MLCLAAFFALSKWYGLSYSSSRDKSRVTTYVTDAMLIAKRANRMVNPLAIMYSCIELTPNTVSKATDIDARMRHTRNCIENAFTSLIV